MCDDDIHAGRLDESAVSRRAFGIAAAAVAGAAALPAWADVALTEKTVQIKTPDGMSDAVLVYPSAKGKYPAVLIWADAGGLRPVIVDMAKRLAAQGYVVLAPNPFYRTRPSPVFPPPFNLGDPADRAKFMAAKALITDPGADGDARAYLAFLDAQPQTDTKKKAGVQGYCMGGPLSFRTAAAIPGRIGAVGSFHGGGLVTSEPSSPHLLIPKTKASFLVAVAQNDDAKAPGDKDVLKASFEAAGRPATVEVYPGDHGWCVPGGQAYNAPAAEKAWAELTKLYKAALV